ncbi:hypothetical protein, partial [Burkholderia pseudomallei]|uniref:hypothetical protein n=1 Tax=Burkholderia pseudomallei TaxID=28450 RepID=UPI001E3163F9
RTRNPDPRKTKPHAHKNVGFVSSLKPRFGGAFCLSELAARIRPRSRGAGGAPDSTSGETPG